MKKGIILLACGLGLALASAASAGQHFMICFPGAPGNAEQAAPMVEKMARFLASGFGEAAMDGRYLNTLAACQRYLQDQKPALAIVSPSVLYRFGRDWQLAPLLETVSATQADNRFHLVARAPVKAPWSPAGKQIASSALDGTGLVEALLARSYPREQVAQIRWQATEKVLEVLKAAAGAPEAVLLTPLQWASLQMLPLKKAWREVWQSPDVGGAPLVVIGQRLNPEQQRRLSAWLTQQPLPPEGVSALAGLRIDRFSSQRLTLYQSAPYGEGK